MKQFIIKNKIIWLLVLVVSFFGCNDDDDATLEQVVAGFVHTINEDTGMVSFLNLSENAISYSWDFGDGTTSTLINPEKTYPTGTYTVSLTATNNASSSTFEDEIVINVPLPINIPVTFDDPNVNYAITTFGGVSFEIVDNPDPSGSNTSTSKVGAITNVGAAWEGLFFDLGVPLDLATLKTIKVNFWSNTPIDVLLKLEQGTEGDAETTASHGGTGWEELLFTFNTSGSYMRLTFFVDGPGTTSGTFYIDDILQIETPPLPCEAETMQSLAAADLNITFMSDPGASIIEDGTSFGWIDNPDFMNDVNKSCKVAEIVKAGVNPWDNTQIDLDAKLDFNSNTGLKIKVWSARADTEVRIKLEEIGVPANATEQFVTTSVTNAWEELTFPFTATDSDKFDKIVIFFDLNANNTDTYYFDDLMLYGTGSGGGGGGGGFDDGLLTNGDFENGTTAWIGTDGLPNVQTDGGNSFHLVNVETAGDAFDVNLSQVVSITQGETYILSFEASSDRDRTMLAGIGLNEDPWNAATETVNLTTTTQTYTLTLTATDFGIPNSRVLFDMGADVGVVVIDNVSLFLDNSGGGGGGGGGGGTGDNLAANGDFETGDETGWFVFQNGGTAALDNTINNGGSWSASIVADGPGNPAFKQERIGAGTVAAGDVVQISFDHIGSTAGEGGVFNLILFGEGAAGASFTHVFNPAPTLGDSWATFTGTFAIPGGTDVSEGISFLIESVCGGAPGCNVTANIDNVSVTLNP